MTNIIRPYCAALYDKVKSNIAEKRTPLEKNKFVTSKRVLSLYVNSLIRL